MTIKDPTEADSGSRGGSVSRARRRLAGSLIIGLAVVGALLIWTGLTTPPAPNAAVPAGVWGSAVPGPSIPVESPVPVGSPSSVQAPAATSSPASAGEAGIRDLVRGPVLPEADPLTVSIPSLGVRSALDDLGLDANQAIELPRVPTRAGWFSRGATPGALGPAVIVGHATWDGAPGVFYRLGALRGGERIEVTRDDGRVAIFAVERVARYDKSRFPSRAVYGAIDHAGLRLVTCGGAYDRAKKRYVDNVVVFARLQSVRAAPA